ncbi:helix-turn-helix domain-containing protein [Nocardioides sp. MH1]|uniref:helix-turn-helix domain-containing protein n=1 Tax=Nocardioides sp. MH1 TaxID=3242490 RepID=UPI0035206B87
MRFSEPGVPPLALIQLLNSDVLDPEAVAHFRRLIGRQGISEPELVQGDRQVPIRWFRDVYPDLDHETATLLGLAFAEQAQLTSFGPLSLPLVSAGSVSEVFELLRFLPIISSALRPHFHHGQLGLTVGLTGHTGDADLDCLVITYGGAALLRLLDVLTGGLPGVSLHLSWKAPRIPRKNADLFAGRLVFEAHASFIDVPVDTLQTPCRFPDPVAYRLAITELRRTLERRSSAVSFTESVRRLVEEDPGCGTSHNVAALLGVSASTLKRRLDDEGTTFRDVRQSLLRERAIVRLLDQSLTVSQIAKDLGYSDTTNFSHAFKRWTGQSPSAFRQAGRRQPG